VATFAIAAAAVLVYAWSLADSQRVEDVLFLFTASIYAEPWRVLTSTFIHRLLPHFVFNLFTLWWFGREVERRYGRAILVSSFFSALWVGHLSMLAAGLLPLHGMSGGVCGLYGLLLVTDWKGNLYRTLKQHAAYWLYPLALLALFVANHLGLIAVANLNHVVAIGFGGLVGLAMTARARLILLRSIIAVLTIATTLIGAYRFERPWQHLAPLQTLECSTQRRPIGDVTRNSFVRVVLTDESRRAKSIYYIDPNGEKVLVSANNRRVAYRLMPYVGTVWQIDVSDRCRVQFEVTQPGVVVIP
jgi:membrane associated rhomboid family serine protease